MDLSIIIINYNSGDLIKDCVSSIYQYDYLIKFEIIIVDNNSNDNSHQEILSAFPEIKWINMNYNSGFARANNEGIRHAFAPVVLLLNPDTLIMDNAIQRSFNKFQKDPYVACGVQLINLDNSPQISGNFAMTGGLNYLLPLPFLGIAFKFLASLLNVKKPNVPDSKDLVEVDWINGAFLMVKKTAIDKAGLLDEDFFLYAEEAEWCGRLKKIGPLSIYGQYKVTHLQGVSSNQTFQSKTEGYQNLFDRKGLQIMVSNLVRIRKQFGIVWFLIIILIYVLDIPIFAIGIFISNILGKSEYNYTQLNNFISNVAYLIKLSPTIISNKKYFYKVL